MYSTGRQSVLVASAAEGAERCCCYTNQVGFGNGWWQSLRSGGTGGFGGGGGGSPGGCTSKVIGIGGGGGDGGFGGGGGGGYTPSNLTFSPGLGGFAAANAVAEPINADVFCGGGGAGLGGAVFVVDGGSLTITGDGFEQGSIAAGGAAYGATCPNAGQGFGSALFLQGGSGAVSFSVPDGRRYPIYGPISDEASAAAAGAQNPGNSPGARGLSIDGPGTLILNGASTFAGTTAVNAGALGGNGSGIGPVTVASGAQVAPGDPAIASGIGTLGVGPVTWNAGGAMAFQISASGADKLLVSGPLNKAGSGSYTFHFGMGDRPAVLPERIDARYKLE